MPRLLRRLIWTSIFLAVVSAATGSAPPVVIRVWLPGFAAYKEVMARDFEAGYPGIRLDLICQEPSHMQDRLMAAIVARSAPDVCLVDLRALGSLYAADACTPLDSYLADLRDLGGIDPLLLRLLSVDGKIWGVPATAHPLALYIRQDWLTRLQLKAPTTWSEFALVAEAFTAKDPDGDGKKDTFGLAERWPPNDPEIALRFLPWLFQAGGLVAVSREGKWTPGFGQTGGVKALRLRRRLWESGLIPPGAPTNTRQENLALFTSGQAGMIIEDERCVPAVREALGDSVITLPLPRDIRMCTVGEGLCFVLLSTAFAKWEAFAFVQWWLSREAQERLILGWDVKAGGASADVGAQVLSPREDLDPAAMLGEPLYAGFVASFPHLAPEPYCPQYAALKLIVARAAAEAMGPEKTVEEALAAATKEAAALFSPG